jgi:hypothetical protein
MKRSDITFKFVEFVPKELEEGTLYISTEYATAVHRCCCGCGSKITTPLDPDEWRLIFDGKTVSLEPSIGNWSFPCQSHYWIRRNKVVWSGALTKEQVAKVRRGRVPAGQLPAATVTSDADPHAGYGGLWSRIKKVARIRRR